MRRIGIDETSRSNESIEATEEESSSIRNRRCTCRRVFNLFSSMALRRKQRLLKGRCTRTVTIEVDRSINQAKLGLIETLPQPKVHNGSIQISRGQDDQMVEVLPQNMLNRRCFDVCDRLTISVNLSRQGKIASHMILVSRMLRKSAEAPPYVAGARSILYMLVKLQLLSRLSDLWEGLGLDASLSLHFTSLHMKG